MQFQKKTILGNLGSISKFFFYILLLISLLFVIVIFIDKINFPKPNKLIEKSIPNENFKIIK